MTRLLCVLLWLFAAPALADTRTLLQLVDYLGVDYPEAVQHGEIVNADEYAEMQEFSTRIASEVASLPTTAASPELARLSGQLGALVASKGEAATVAETTRALRELLTAHYDIELTPRAAPDLARGKALYTTHCGACHGAEGRGDGPAGVGVEPAPINFHDETRARERSLFGLFNTITLGVDGTPMTSFAHLPDGDRWALAWYVGGLFASEAMLVEGQAAWKNAPVNLETAATRAPAELAAQRPDGEALMAWLRHNPQVLFADRPDPLSFAEQAIRESVALYQAGKTRDAADRAVTAYLEGFELAEAALSNVSPDAMRGIEQAMMSYRKSLLSELPAAQVSAEAEALLVMLADARQMLSGESLSPSVAFTSSLIILLREGLEAILVLAAMVAFLVKTGRPDALRYVHLGWASALALGFATWGVSSHLIAISGATRELTEGFTALFAAVVLFYVGFWMHRNASARAWSQYLQGQMQNALSQQQLWLLTLVSFLAVYREVFETVLFYQALWVQAPAAGSHIVGGALLAAALLAAVWWGINRFGMRLPLSQFFRVSAVLMIVLAIIFVGKGVAALQEAGRLPLDAVRFPRIELLGVFPTLQGLAAQALVLVVALVMLMRREPDGEH